MKKTKIAIIVIVLLLIVVLIAIFVPKLQKHEESNEYFSLDPKGWISDDVASDKEGDLEIDIFKATRANSMFQTNQQDYYTGDGITSFYYFGSYKGEKFNSVYLSENFSNASSDVPIYAQEQLAKDNMIMRISPYMNPSNGVIDGFIMAKQVDMGFEFYIFVDEDWRRQLKFTNIVWGGDFSNPSTLTEMQFNYSQEEQGIYIQELSQNVNFFSPGYIKGGIIVGEITKDSLKDIKRGQQLNITFMMVR